MLPVANSKSEKYGHPMICPQPEAAIRTDLFSEAAHTAQVSAKLLVPFVNVAARLGLNVAAALARVGLSPADLDRTDLRISHALVDQLLRAASSLSGRPDLGLLAAEELSPDHLDIVEYLARCQPDVGAALKSILRFRALLHDALEAQLDVNADRVLLQVDFRELPIAQCAHEFVLATFLLAARRMTGLASLTPLEVHFAHAQPRDTELHQRIFQCPVLFAQGHTALVYSRALLATPQLDADAGLASVLERHASARLESLCSVAKLDERVRAIMLRDVGTGRLTADILARQLGMSSRTLHRRLAAHGCTYRSVLDSVRREIALHCLRDPNVALSEVRHLIGFSTGPAFHRAFRRWTGGTPTSFRTAAQRSQRDQVDTWSA
jgi:AraC-like DNA-binding protein